MRKPKPTHCITVKWFVFLYGVIFGTYPLAPWQSGLVRLAGEKGKGGAH
jgi:hypothetical protein